LLNNPFPLSYIPYALTGYSSKMTFKQRFLNTVFYLMGDRFFSYLTRTTITTLNQEFNIAPSMSLYEIENSPSMVLITSDFVLEYPRPVLPNVKVIGSLSATPAMPLPNELEAFMNGDSKVVYIAFGSTFEELSLEKLRILVDAVNRLPYKVLWKIKTNITDIGSHVKIVGWVPQNDILGHKNTIVFYSHCGHNSMYEAAYHGIPVLAMPIHGDQIDNANQILQAGFGVKIDFLRLTSDDIVNGIMQLTKDRYRENANRLSIALRSQPRSSRDTAVDWIEYVIANKGAKHLRMEGYNLTIIEYYMLDVLLVWIITVVTIIYIVKRFVQLMYFRCCKVKT
ncbi:uncharacterized protein TRIADDRAFT_2130, partial [Trichoplax adhaerens]